MNSKDLILLFASILSNIFGQTFLKAGANQLAEAKLGSLFKILFYIATSPSLLTGLFSYGLGAVAYILLLSRVDLSVAAPAIALTYVCSIFLGYFFFKETLEFHKLIGVFFISLGVILVIKK